MAKEKKPEEAKIESLEYKEPNLPTPQSTEEDFRYGKNQEKLDAQIAVRNLQGKVKVSETDTTGGYLENKLIAGVGVIIEKQNSPGNETLKFSGELTFGGDASDGDLTIANGETVTLTADTDVIVKNYKSINIASGGTLTIQTTNTAPVVIKCLENCTIAGEIDFNSTFDDTTAFSAFLLATGTTFTPTGVKSTNRGGTDLILNCAGNLDLTGGTIDLGATSPGVAGALRIVALGTYTAGTYTSSSTVEINKPTIF